MDLSNLIWWVFGFIGCVILWFIVEWKNAVEENVNKD